MECAGHTHSVVILRTAKQCNAPQRTNIGGAHTHAKQKAHNMAQRQYFSPCVSEVTETKLSHAHYSDVNRWIPNIVNVQHPGVCTC